VTMSGIIIEFINSKFVYARVLERICLTLATVVLFSTRNAAVALHTPAP
jgi:hypothetical protein